MMVIAINKFTSKCVRNVLFHSKTPHIYFERNRFFFSLDKDYSRSLSLYHKGLSEIETKLRLMPFFGRWKEPGGRCNSFRTNYLTCS